MNQNDLLARILAVLLSGLAAIWATFSTQDRFTGTEGEVLEERVNGIRRDLDRLPPDWLQRDVNELKRRVEALEDERD